MKVIGSYLVLGNQPNAQLKPEDGAGPVLDIIAGAGATGAAHRSIVAETGFNPDFVDAVLKNLTANGMVTELGETGAYKLTAFGEKARFLVKR